MSGQNTALILSLIAIIFISGCTAGTPAAGGGAGIVFESFEADFTDVFIDEPVTLRASVRNTGNADSGQGGIIIIGVDKKFIGKPSEGCSWGKLLGADPVFGTSGESALCDITLNFESGQINLPQGLSTNFQPTARLFYSYPSNVVKNIPVVSQIELRGMQNRGEALPLGTSTTSGGPISLDIKTSGPIRFFDNDVTFPLEIQITNMGGGTAYIKSIDDPKNWNKVTLNFDALDASGISIVEGCDDPEIPLFRGQSATVVCKAKVNVNNIIGPVQKSIIISADYNYFVDRSVTLTVSYRETGGSGGGSSIGGGSLLGPF